MLKKIICFFKGHEWYEDQFNYPSLSIMGNEIELKGINHICARCNFVNKTVINFNLFNSNLTTEHKHHYTFPDIAARSADEKVYTMEMDSVQLNMQGANFKGSGVCNFKDSSSIISNSEVTNK